MPTEPPIRGTDSAGSDHTAGSGAQLLRDLNRLRAQLAAAPEASRLTPVGLGGVLLGDGVLSDLPSRAAAMLGEFGEIALLIDRQPMRTADGTELKPLVAQMLESCGTVRTVALGGDTAEAVHADADTLAIALEAVRSADLLVTVGSGTLTDIGKYVSAKLGGLPHIVVQTAASVNGFGDDQSVLVVEGVKRTTPTRWVDLLIIDSGVIGGAPSKMNRAGLGDLLASYTAPADWLLARQVGQDDSFSPAVVALARDHVDIVLDRAAGIGHGEAGALEALGAALTLSGIAMGAAGKTAPGSGMEHTSSHLIEMTDHGTSALHGAQVGVLSVLAACLWRIVRTDVSGGALTELRIPDQQEMRARIVEAFAAADPTGAMAAECFSDYRRKLERLHEKAPSPATLAEGWPAFERAVAPLLAEPQALAQALIAAGAPTHLSELGIEPERARWALLNCHLMRDRFTIADLAFLLGRWDEAGVDAVVRMAESFGVGL